MPVQPPTESVEDRFEEDLARLDQGLRDLKAQYNRYFTGALERPPVLLQASLAALIRRQSDAGASTKRRSSEQFRFNSMVSTFQVLTEMWNRNVRKLEEGRPTAPSMRRGSPAPPSPGRSAEQEVCRTRLSAAGADPKNEGMRSPYSSYLQAARDGGQTKASISYQTFFERMRTRLKTYAERTGQTDVTCRVVIVDNRPILKLRSEP